MAERDKQTRRKLSEKDIQAYKDLNKELPEKDRYPDNDIRGPERHTDAKQQSSRDWHAHVGKTDHIPAESEKTDASKAEPEKNEQAKPDDTKKSGENPQSDK